MKALIVQNRYTPLFLIINQLKKKGDYQKTNVTQQKISILFIIQSHCVLNNQLLIVLYLCNLYSLLIQL
jgi:hypothetical protein